MGVFPSLLKSNLGLVRNAKLEGDSVQAAENLKIGVAD